MLTRFALVTSSLVLALAVPAVGTPPKERAPGTSRTAKAPTVGGEGRRVVEDRNAMVLRGGVSEPMWLEALHRLTRVPEPRREVVTRLVRNYVAEATAWRKEQSPKLKRLTTELVALREAGEPIPDELRARIRTIRAEMPKLSDLQARVWDVLTNVEDSRLKDEVRQIKKDGLPKDVADGRRLPGTPAQANVERASETDASTEAAARILPLWSFVDDPQAGRPLPPADEAPGDPSPADSAASAD